MTAPDPQVTIGAVQSLLDGADSILTYISPDGACWPLSGGLAPVLGAQEGVNGTSWKNLMAVGKLITQQGAREDGDTYIDTVYDPLDVDFTADIYGYTPGSFRRIAQGWFDSWDMKRTGRIVWWSREFGEWWLVVRKGGAITDDLKFAPAHMHSQQYSWVAHADFPFWQSFDSTDQIVPTAQVATGFLRFLNRGNQVAWPRYVFQGPGTLSIGDGLTDNTVTFGPIAAGQTAIITTLPRSRGIVELTTRVNLYPLLAGRFTVPLPAAGIKPVWSRIPVTITGARPGTTKLVGSVTPLRDWPE